MRKPAALAIALALTAILGCGTEPERRPPPPPLNDTPQGAILRLEWAFENRKLAELGDLLTGDFTFEFSNATDPELVQEWETGWYKSDELLCARNLFEGGYDRDGVYHRPASRIEIRFSPTVPVADATVDRDTTRYKVLVTRLSAEIEIPSDDPLDPVVYIIENAAQRIFLVRGDAAAGLEATQARDASRWYIWSWRDETERPALAPATEPAAAMRGTWGALKGEYR